MRNLLIFMLLVAFFVLGNRNCHGLHFGFGGVTGSGPVQTETRSVRDFQAIDLNISGEVEVSIGENYALEISAQQNLLPVLLTEVEGGTLSIRSDEGFSTSEPIKIRLTTPTLHNLSISGSGKIQVLDSLHSEKTNLSVSGSGDIICPKGDFGRLVLSIAGSGGIELGGRANDMKVRVSGSGDVKAKNLTTNILNADISGSGTITADVSAEIDAAISGSGDIFYTGSPSVETSISGSGKVKKLAAQ